MEKGCEYLRARSISWPASSMNARLLAACVRKSVRASSACRRSASRRLDSVCATTMKNPRRTDFLTQAANKRAFIELAGQEIERARRYSHPFSIAYLDVDRFKQVNDTLGHAAGDSLLVAVSDTAGRIARSPDVLARLGGDEFALLLVESDPEQTRSAVERVKRALDDAVMAGGWDVGFSIGATTFLTPPANADAALALADELMYSVKAGGGDSAAFATWTR